MVAGCIWMIINTPVSITVVFIIRVYEKFHWLIHPTHSLTVSIILIQSKWFCWWKLQHYCTAITPTAKANPCVVIVTPTRNWLHFFIVITIIFISVFYHRKKHQDNCHLVLQYLCKSVSLDCGQDRGCQCRSQCPMVSRCFYCLHPDCLGTSTPKTFHLDIHWQV